MIPVVRFWVVGTLWRMNGVVEEAGETWRKKDQLGDHSLPAARPACVRSGVS